jgi:hypothetical protein
MFGNNIFGIVQLVLFLIFLAFDVIFIVIFCYFCILYNLQKYAFDTKTCNINNVHEDDINDDCCNGCCSDDCCLKNKTSCLTPTLSDSDDDSNDYEYEKNKDISDDDIVFVDNEHIFQDIPESKSDTETELFHELKQ